MESRTTPSLSFSMPGWMSATVRGRRGGGQIWLTVRRTGGFFFHRVRSWQGVLASGILGGHGESANRLDPARFSGGGPVRNSDGPSASPGTHHPDAGVDTGRRAPSGARRPHLAQPPRFKEH